MSDRIKDLIFRQGGLIPEANINIPWPKPLTEKDMLDDLARVYKASVKYSYLDDESKHVVCFYSAKGNLLGRAKHESKHTALTEAYRAAWKTIKIISGATS